MHVRSVCAWLCRYRHAVGRAMIGRLRAGACAGAAAALLSACAGKPEPAPSPPPPVRQAVPPVVAGPAAEPSAQDSPDPPLSAGDWSYAGDPAGSIATFGPMDRPSFTIRCDKARRRVSLAVEGEALPLSLGTSFGRRTLPAGATLAADDPLLDEIAFSRGRFTVERDGPAALIMPTWPEPARVIEDCRG
jgi:hypothetical protein